MDMYKMNLTDLSYNTSALIFYRNLTTGRGQGLIPSQASSVEEAHLLPFALITQESPC